jgi:hypothetical protein
VVWGAFVLDTFAASPEGLHCGARWRANARWVPGCRAGLPICRRKDDSLCPGPASLWWRLGRRHPSDFRLGGLHSRLARNRGPAASPWDIHSSPAEDDFCLVRAGRKSQSRANVRCGATPPFRKSILLARLHAGAPAYAPACPRTKDAHVLPWPLLVHARSRPGPSRPSLLVHAAPLRLGRRFSPARIAFGRRFGSDSPQTLTERRF